MTFNKLKKQVINILSNKGLNEEDIRQVLTDEDILMGLNNNFSADTIAEAVLI